MTRIEEIDAALQAIRPGWPFLLAELQARVADDTERLITQNNEETRGRIKALRDLMDLPEALEAERAGILAAELPDEGSAL
ncbi:hypothetical protein [Massilia aerilata]|uniref:Uncharacterized protein n=1 Tax=Massilia aerilata TaxID=453817 RepID=A0ABW0S1D3_9BURK